MSPSGPNRNFGSRFQARREDSVELRMRYAEDDLDRIDSWVEDLKKVIDTQFHDMAAAINDRLSKLEDDLGQVKSRATTALATMAASAVLLAINILVERGGGG